MNWLIYICGGYMWMAFWAKHLIDENDSAGQRIVYIAMHLLSWIWICWRFFSEVHVGLSLI